VVVGGYHFIRPRLVLGQDDAVRAPVVQAELGQAAVEGRERVLVAKSAGRTPGRVHLGLRCHLDELLQAALAAQERVNVAREDAALHRGGNRLVGRIVGIRHSVGNVG
jgi:hypothetical protein